MLNFFKRKSFPVFILICFINAFVDVGHKALIQNVVFKAYDGDLQIILTSVVNGLILLPFLMFFSLAGGIGDRFPKNKTMKWSALAAVFITLGITASYYMGQFWVAFGLTFLLASQSAIYSPSKYGYIKELMGQDRLTAANGAVQAATTAAIMIGLAVFSFMFEYLIDSAASLTATEALHAMAPLGWVLVGLSALEWLAACLLPTLDKAPVENTSKVAPGLLKPVTGHSVIWLSVLGLTVFWSVCQMLLAVYPTFVEQTQGMSNTAVIQMIMALSGVGIVFGSLFVSKASRHHIETGLIPLGGFGLFLAVFNLPMAADVYVQGALFFGMGFAGALFIVPLNALIQFHADDAQAGKVLAANNFVQTLGMATALTLTVGMAYLSLSMEWMFYAASALTILTAVLATIKLPHSLMRLFISVLMRQRYKLAVKGFDNFPKDGGVLLVGNHISWVDWLVLQLAAPRHIRFVMEKSIYSLWYLKGFLDFFNVIPIAAGASRGSIQAMADALNEGDVVCIFPEGAISRNGHLGEFKKGFTLAAAKANDDVVVLPFYLGGLWGSDVSRAQAKLVNNRKVESLRRDVFVSFGDTVPVRNVTRFGIKQAVFELSQDAWESFIEKQPTVIHSIVKTARKMRGEEAINDTMAGSMSYRKLIGVSYSMMPAIRQVTKQANIGLLVPTATGGVIANLAAMMAGKTVINMNYTAPIEALKASLELAEVDAIITSRLFVKKLTLKGMLVERALEGRTVVYLEDLKESLSNATILRNIGLCTSLMPTAWLLRHVKADQPAAILFSSGSEGTPKGIVLSNANLMANVKQISDVLNTQTEDKVVNQLPIFHAFGYSMGMLLPLVEGIPMITHADPTDAVNVGKAVARNKATIMCGTSTFLRLYARNRKMTPLMLDSLRIVVSGAEKLSADVRTAFESKFHKTILEGYGATETAPVISVNLPDHLDTSYWVQQIGHKKGTVGMGLPGTSIRIVDLESLELLPTGEDGLILVSGPQLMQGYLKQPEKSAEVIVEIDGKRFYKTMDKGHLDEDGFLTITDRLNLIIKVGGEMVSLSACSQSVQSACKDEEVIFAGVGVPCDKKGEKVVMCYDKAEIDIKQIQSALNEAGVPAVMQPSEWRYLSEIPVLGSGKVDYKQLKILVAA